MDTNAAVIPPAVLTTPNAPVLALIVPDAVTCAAVKAEDSVAETAVMPAAAVIPEVPMIALAALKEPAAVTP